MGSTENAKISIEISETKSDQSHNGKKIDKLIVSQYIEVYSYAVTYSKEDNSNSWMVT